METNGDERFDGMKGKGVGVNWGEVRRISS